MNDEDRAAAVAEFNRLTDEAYDRLRDTGVLGTEMPVARVRLVHIDRVQANDYNPNSVATTEMRLLYTSIEQDGYTQPVVTIIEPRGDIVSEWGTFSQVSQKPAEHLHRLCWGTPQDSLMGKEASLRLRHSGTAPHDGESRSASLTVTAVETSANGSETSGESAKSTNSEDSASPTSGTSPASETYSISSENVAHTSGSKQNAPIRYLHTYETSRVIGSVEYGLTLTLPSSESTAPQSPLTNWHESSDAALMPSEPSDENSAYLDLLVADSSKAIIVDGFHRYTTMRTQKDIYDAFGGYLPIVVIDKPIADRVASTVRHNRARGKHSVAGMSSLVFTMLREGESDETICNKIGLEPEELQRLKYITGFAKLFENHVYGAPVLGETQVRIKRKYKQDHPDETVPTNI